MTDRELWVRTCKTAGAMVGGSIAFLGLMSLVLLLAVGRPAAAPASEAQASPGSGPGTPSVLPAGAPGSDPTLPSKKGARHIVSAARPGESI